MRLRILPRVHEPFRQAVEGRPARDVVDQKGTSTIPIPKSLKALGLMDCRSEEAYA